MSHYANRIKPVLEALDELVPLDKPVTVDDLISVFKNIVGVQKISLVGVPAKSIQGVHLGSMPSGTVAIIYQRCEAHVNVDSESSCPGCQLERYIIAKELVHALDKGHEKTSPDEAAEMLIDQLVRGALTESAQALADGWGEVWAIELLIRYRHRLVVTGDNRLPPSPALTRANSTGDYSYLARQYGVPQNLVAHAYSDRFMSAIREIREIAGIPNTF